MASQAASLLLGAIVGAAISRGLSPEALDSWGWRVPFILGLVIGPIGLYIRRNMADTEAFLHAKKTARRAASAKCSARIAAKCCAASAR